MNRNSPYLVANKHATLSPSSPAWLNYTEEKFDRFFYSLEQARIGTEKHELAQRLIKLRQELPDTGQTLNRYVNECIGHRMTPEWLLYYSDNCFGTADACGFRNNRLRVFDLKTGIIEASFTQLKIYVALFCLENRFRPFDIELETRIYQNDDVKIEEPDPDEIFHIMEKIKYLDNRLNLLREGDSE